MKKAYEIWNDGEDTGKLIPVDEIEECIGTFDFTLYKIRIPGVTAENVEAKRKELNAAFDEYAADRVVDFLADNGIEYETADECYTECDFILSFNAVEQAFVTGEYDTVPVYTWWDGSNFRQEERPEIYDEIEYDRDAEHCLDEWDGSDFNNGHTGLHDYYAKLDDGRYLMIYRSQWQGDHTTAEIVTEAEFLEKTKA